MLLFDVPPAGGSLQRICKHGSRRETRAFLHVPCANPKTFLRARRSALLFAAPALIAAWALAGFYASLGPSIVRSLAHSKSFALGGATLFVLGGSGALASYLLRNRAARTVMLTGSTALAGGVALTLLAFSRGSVSVFFVGAMIAGAGFGGAFQGAIRTVVPLAAPTERAGVLSILYVLAYLAMGVPAVFGGLGVVRGGGLMVTANEYGLGVIALAAFALIGTAMRAVLPLEYAPATVQVDVRNAPRSQA